MHRFLAAPTIVDTSSVGVLSIGEFLVLSSVHVAALSSVLVAAIEISSVALSVLHSPRLGRLALLVSTGAGSLGNVWPGRRTCRTFTLTRDVDR